MRNKALLKDVHEFVVLEKDMSVALEEWVTDNFAGEIPYGHLTGDFGTVEEWVCDRMSGDIDKDLDFFGVTREQVQEFA